MIRKTKRMICCLLAIALLTALLPASAESAGGRKIKAYVIANTMKVYQYPNPLSELLGVMSYGEGVRVLAWQDGWFRVQNTKGKIGYCEYGGLGLQNPNRLNMFAYVKETGAFVYAKPISGAKAIAIASMGDELHVVGMTADKQWLRVQSGAKYGYVQTDQMSKTPLWPTDDFVFPD